MREDEFNVGTTKEDTEKSEIELYQVILSPVLKTSCSDFH